MLNFVNAITAQRIVLSLAMILVAPFSFSYWLFYVLGGLSDGLDGYLARRFHMCSEFGAKFDSAADLIFGIAIAITLVKMQVIPNWLWLSVGLIACLRCLNYLLSFCKFRSLTALHTVANKTTGVLIFLYPIFHTFFGITLTGILLSLVALYAALEEVAILLLSKTRNLNLKSVFECLKPQKALALDEDDCAC